MFRVPRPLEDALVILLLVATEFSADLSMMRAVGRGKRWLLLAASSTNSSLRTGDCSRWARCGNNWIAS